MDPTAIPWLDAINSLGTLGGAAVLLWAGYTRRIRTASEMDAALAEKDRVWAVRLAEIQQEHDEQVKYIEARRTEERDARLKAEERLGKLTDAVGSVTRLVQAIREEVTRGGQRAP